MLFKYPFKNHDIEVFLLFKHLLKHLLKHLSKHLLKHSSFKIDSIFYKSDKKKPPTTVWLFLKIRLVDLAILAILEETEAVEAATS